MQFPFSWNQAPLQPEDLDRYAPFFRRAVRRHLSCEEVCLEPAPAGEAARDVGRAGQPGIDSAGHSLALPLWEGERFLGMAVASGGDPMLSRGRTREWLRERGELICREMRLIKQWSADPVTGLLNGRALLEKLQMLLSETAAGNETGAKPAGHLMLIEIFPRAGNAEQGLLGIAGIGSQLEGLIGGDAALHHLGAGVFAQVRLGIPEEELLKMGNGLLRWLKRENAPRGHIGIAEVGGPASASDREAAKILERAWLALGVARRRAPHALCTHGVLASAKEDPLHGVPPAVMAELQRLWRKVARFALLLLHQDQEPAVPCFSEIPIGPGQGVLPLSVREALVFLPGAGEQEARRWISSFRKQFLSSGKLGCSIGIAFFPCAGFKKKDLVLNARKALLHTRFFGPDSATVFDGASLNISGDVFYEEGDLARAIKEYRRGLVLAPDSINLLNSLGVAYAQMNRYRKAVPLFEKVLAIHPDNFMALFNLGYAHLAFADRIRALHYFSRALALDEDNFDLLLQLGILRCESGDYRQAAELLFRAAQCEGEQRNGAARARLYYHLGQARKETGEHQQAMVDLQRAVQCNPHDAGAVSLLGEIYALEDQGEEIALALCRQAVEMDDGRSEHWRRLGLVQWLRGEEEEAVAAARRSLHLDRKNSAALRLLGEIFTRQGKQSRARQVYLRLLRIRPGDAQAEQALSHPGGKRGGKR